MTERAKGDRGQAPPMAGHDLPPPIKPRVNGLNLCQPAKIILEICGCPARYQPASFTERPCFSPTGQAFHLPAKKSIVVFQIVAKLLPMGLASIADIRRRELVQAAFQVIKREGLQFATAAKMEKEAGTSKGMLHKYFRNKEELAHAAVRHALALRCEDFLKRLKRSETPSARLWASIALHVHPKYLEPGFSRAWISLIAEGTEKKPYARIVKALYARDCSNLVHSLRLLRHEGDAWGAALALQCFFDGCRYRSGFLVRKYKPRKEMANLLHYLMHTVPGFDSSVARQEIETWPESR
jgi:AcrR family transcriptional regulator